MKNNIQKMTCTDIETKLSHALLRSSHDFIQSAVKYANEADGTSWKFAVLHLASSIELLLKSKLAEEHWSLVFANPDKASIDNLQTGEFQSVDIDTLLKRLKGVDRIRLSDRDTTFIKKLKSIRNKIIHFHININENTIASLTAQGLNTYIEFHDRNIAPNWVEYSTFGHELSRKLIEFKGFVKTRMGELSAKLDSSHRPKTNYFWECSQCLQDATVFTEEMKLKCLFCGHSTDIVEMAELLSDDQMVRHCPSCNTKSYIVTSVKEDQTNSECLICGYFVGSPQRFIDLNNNILPHLRSFENS
jgi:hypothetical protein